jgi:hypothetical protein
MARPVDDATAAAAASYAASPDRIARTPTGTMHSATPSNQREGVTTIDLHLEVSEFDLAVELLTRSRLIITDSRAAQRRRQDHASHDVIAGFSKWLEAGEESIFSLETEKNLPGASYELREASARTEEFPEIKLSRRLVEFRSGRSSL